MLGAKGLTNATENAILNANYIKERLQGHFDTLYTGEMGRAAHEMIIDCREFKEKGIEATLELAKSSNSKVVIVGSGKDGMPLILGNQ